MSVAPVTVALNCCVAPAWTDAVCGATEIATTTTPAGLTTTVAVADWVALAWLLAVTWTVAGDEGAVNRPA